MGVSEPPARRVPPIVQYWDQKERPEEIDAMMSTVASHNLDAPHVIFDAGRAEEFIGTYFSAREVSAFRACAVPAMQADYFRYCAVFALGGTYVDADLRCVAPLRTLTAGIEKGELFRLPTWLMQNNIFSFLSPCHPLLGLAIEVATANLEHRLEEGPLGVWVGTGPGIFTFMYLLRDAGSIDAFVTSVRKGEKAVSSAELFCEVVGDYGRMLRAFDGVCISPIEKSKAWLRPPAHHPRHKRTDAHWLNVRESIYR
jgi:Glycosyltransferase sugar-binding region containing DXD motif